MPFKLSQQAASYLKRLDKATRKRIDEGLREAIKDPIGASDHLVNRGDTRKIRVGGLRIVFRINVLPRGDVYGHTRR